LFKQSFCSQLGCQYQGSEVSNVQMPLIFVKIDSLSSLPSPPVAASLVWAILLGDLEQNPPEQNESLALEGSGLFQAGQSNKHPGGRVSPKLCPSAAEWWMELFWVTSDGSHGVHYCILLHCLKKGAPAVPHLSVCRVLRPNSHTPVCWGTPIRELYFGLLGLESKLCVFGWIASLF
jgi:hypothetical protein